MKKLIFDNVTLKLVLQSCDNLQAEKPVLGALSLLQDGQMLFEEEIKQPRQPRHPMLFSGNYISMVSVGDGQYCFAMKRFKIDRQTDGRLLANAIAGEVMNAVMQIKE